MDDNHPASPSLSVINDSFADGEPMEDLIPVDDALSDIDEVHIHIDVYEYRHISVSMCIY
jgi:hypothetical protein